MNRATYSDKPFYSVCSRGRSRWFWIASCSWAEYFNYCNRFDSRISCGPGVEPFSGYADSKPAAIEAALQSLGAARSLAEEYPSGTASHHHRRLCCQSRAKKRSEKQDTAPVEYLYREIFIEGEPCSDTVRIVKKTAKRVYVEDEVLRCHGAEGEYFDVRTLVLDRDKLEREGSVSHPREWWYRFYTTPPEERQETRHTPECLRELGLSLPCTEQEIREAYRRKARALHPDQGGEHDAFIHLKNAFDASLRLVVRGGTTR